MVHKYGTMRLWADELDSLPEYSRSMPTGTCLHKCWKRKIYDDIWIVGCYGFPDERGFLNMWFNVVLLQGPRRRERSRLKTACCVKHELRMQPTALCTCGTDVP